MHFLAITLDNVFLPKLLTFFFLLLHNIHFNVRPIKSVCAFTQSGQSLLTTKTAASAIQKCAPMKILSNCLNAQADLNLCDACMSEGKFSDIGAHITALLGPVVQN